VGRLAVRAEHLQLQWTFTGAVATGTHACMGAWWRSSEGCGGAGCSSGLGRWRMAGVGMHPALWHRCRMHLMTAPTDYVARFTELAPFWQAGASTRREHLGRGGSGGLLTPWLEKLSAALVAVDVRCCCCCYKGISHGGCYPHISGIYAQASSRDLCLESRLWIIQTGCCTCSNGLP
jgi:hypothetical protein